MVSVNILADFFDRDIRTVQLWAEKDGMPKLAKGRYDLNECAKWRLQKLEEEIESLEDSGDKDHLALKKEGQRLSNMEREFKVKKLIGGLVDSEAVRIAWAKETKIYHEALKVLKIKLINALEEVTDRSKRQEIITREVNEAASILGELCIESDDDN